MDHAIDGLCELIFIGTTIETVSRMYAFANKGDWFYTKVDVTVMVATYEDSLQLQFDLPEGMASYVRCTTFLSVFPIFFCLYVCFVCVFALFVLSALLFQSARRLSVKFFSTETVQRLNSKILWNM